MSFFDQSRMPHCPTGHLLLRSRARAGTCDRCHRPIEERETILDCRLCNWYVCKDCHPPARNELEDDSVLGTFSLAVGAASLEVARGATELEAFVSELADQLQGAAAGVSCQPTSSARLVEEEAELRPLAGQLSWSDEEACDADHPAAGGQRVQHRGDWEPAGRPPLAAPAAMEAAGCEEERPAPAAMQREPTDLIDLGEESLLDAAPPAPGPAAPRQPPADLLDFARPPPKDEDPLASAASAGRRPTPPFARLGA